MKNVRFRKAIYLSLVFASHSAVAEIWCNQGTVVQIGDISWNQSSIVANYPGLVPDDIPGWVVGNVNMHITHEATENYASAFAGGGGGFGGYSVPNSGEVKVIAYDPYNYITAPSLYHTSEGVKFKLKKCYTIPPMTAVESAYEIALPFVPGNTGIIDELPILINPLDGLDEINHYWLDAERVNN